MSKINKKKFKIADPFTNNILIYNMLLPKKNKEIKNKTPDSQSNLCININSFMNNNQLSVGEYTLSTTERTRQNNSNEIIFDKRIINQKQTTEDTFLNNLIFHKIEIRQLKEYIYCIQTKFNKMHEDYMKYIINNREQTDHNKDYINELEHLESLIARYSIIIFFLIKYQCKFIAKKIFLLMLNENKAYLNFFYMNIFKQFFYKKKNFDLICHGVPKCILKIIKMYSFIIKYSLLFNLTKNKNTYVARYLSLQKMNYKLFILKNELRGNLVLTDIGIKYLYANCLFNSCYFSILSYSSMTIPIKLSELIFKTYKGMNEVIFGKKEKSLLLKTSFNYSLFLYLNGSSELALGQLNLIKEKLINYYDENFCSDDEEDDEVVDVNNFDIRKVCKPLKPKKESEKKLSVHFKDKMLVKREETMKKLERRRGLSKSENTIDKIKEILFNRRASLLNFNENNEFDPLHEANLSKFNPKYFKKRSIRVDDIKKFFISDAKTELNKRNRKCSITENDIKNKKKIQNNFEISNKENKNNSSQSIVDLRASHINFRSLMKINKLNIPKYMTGPLLIETELLMCEIELDSKNIKEVHEHFKNAILILFLFKLKDEQNDVKSLRYFRKKLKTISAYLKDTNKYLEEKNKMDKFEVLDLPIKTSNTFIEINKRKYFKKKIEAKKSSLNLEIHNFQEISDDMTTTNKTENNYYNQFINSKTAAEIKKFFIFLNSLSIYQIKILNDTQPKREIRNDLPILFNGHFRDCLTEGQRSALRKINTMSISRSMILNNPDNIILPSNLNIIALKYNYTDNNIPKKKPKIRKINSKILSLENTKEYGYFKNIIFSKKANKDLQQFLLDNYSLVMKILKGLGEKEIKDIIETPDILMEPIKSFKKNKSECLNIINNCIIYYKEIKELRQLVYELNGNNEMNISNTENNHNVSDEDILTDDSEYNKSVSINIGNSSLINSEEC